MASPDASGWRCSTDPQLKDHVDLSFAGRPVGGVGDGDDMAQGAVGDGDDQEQDGRSMNSARWCRPRVSAPWRRMTPLAVEAVIG